MMTLEQHGGSESGVKWLNAGYILKVETKRPDDETDKRCEKKKKKLRLKSNFSTMELK